MNKKLLDLYCGAGGASMGYHHAGFEVTGVDAIAQPNYPFEFIHSNVFDLSYGFYDEFDFIHASPPCQGYLSLNRKDHNNKYPLLIGPTRTLLFESGKPFVIENVLVNPLNHPLMLCGTMFDLGVIRHRYFETNYEPAPYAPKVCHHVGKAYEGAYCSVYSGGYRSGQWGNKERRKNLKIKPPETIEQWKEAMDIDWMKTRRELIESIPPAYTEWVGKLIFNKLSQKVNL